MKKSLTTFLGIFIAICSFTVCFSQSDFEGEIAYTFEYGELPDQPGIENYLPKEMLLSIKGDKTRMDQKIGTSSSSQIMVFDYANYFAFIAMNMMGQKVLINIDEKTLKESLEENKNFEVEYLEEYKNISGYRCQKAILKSEDQSMTVFFTDKIGNMNHEFIALKGMPLEYTVSQNGMNITVKATSIVKKSIDNAIFTKPTGYQEMSMQDMQKMGMGNFKF